MDKGATPVAAVASVAPSATQDSMSEGIGERAVVDALDEPAIIVDRGVVRVANVRARELLGARIEGRDLRLAIRHPQALERILSGKGGDLDVTGLVEPGRSWRLIVRTLSAGFTLVRLMDRSDSVSAEKMRVDFVANASHELRTPLSTIIGYAETLADDPDLPADMLARLGATVRGEARRMQRIIEDLMSLSRIEADRFVAPDELVPIAEVVRLAVANAEHLRGAATCDFLVDIAEDLPPVRGDTAQLQQVLDNLLSNAVRYGCDGAHATIAVAVTYTRSWVTLSVKDHGPGIARDHLPRVTERFYRVDEARSRETGGTGLGLAIVKHIVERHRGMLEIKSTLGIGTTVTIRLPAAP
ncbi:ATP-binding protein [Sphingomonas lutea]|uniref:histidine kinase n=1 Tax=Sphingomonas lutea TaxID=1045317 RepID=A0A7G9SIY1_9SPHN|nr:ATP-binding protein [Sphingomonas lutea]QNN67806.1 ATP-binding protein [Sphingomonas lutea]